MSPAKIPATADTYVEFQDFEPTGELFARSLEDATIYATEINAITASSDGSKIPMVKNVCERVTIPVNPSIKRKHKLLKEALLGGDYNVNEAESEIPDAALIEGFEFKSAHARSGTKKQLKKIRWADELIV